MKGADNHSLEESGTGTPGSTSWTLLEGVGAGDELSRRRLVELYGSLVYRRYLARVPEEVRRDLAQKVFATVFEKIGRFERRFDGPAFRGWLFKISYHKVGDYIKQKRRESRESQRAPEMPPPGDNRPGPPDAEQDVDERCMLVRRALEMVRSEFEPATYDAACRQLIEGRPAGVVAAAMDKTLNAVYIAKSRVLRRIRDIMTELGELDGRIDTGDAPTGGG